MSCDCSINTIHQGEQRVIMRTPINGVHLSVIKNVQAQSCTKMVSSTGQVTKYVRALIPS